MTLQMVEGEANVRKSSGEERLKLDTRNCIGVCMDIDYIDRQVSG